MIDRDELERPHKAATHEAGVERLRVRDQMGISRREEAKPMSTDIGKLADRLEQEGPESQAELLRMAWETLNPYPGAAAYLDPDYDWVWDKKRDRFTAILDCGAYLSAAEMFIPERCQWTLEGPFAWVRILSAQDVDEFQGRGSTPAYALAAACLRAALENTDGN